MRGKTDPYATVATIPILKAFCGRVVNCQSVLTQLSIIQIEQFDNSIASTLSEFQLKPNVTVMEWSKVSLRLDRTGVS